ncbi:hypothetical protein STENM223S_05951 [Streptomyces tendae]
MADDTGPLVRGEARGHMARQFLQAGRELQVAAPARHDPLAQVGVRFPGDGRLLDARVLQQRVLDLARADLVSRRS